MVNNNEDFNAISKFRSLKPKLIDNIIILNKNNRKNDLSQGLPTLLTKTDLTQKPSFWIEGYGCSASFADMEMIAGQLRNNGFDIADNSDVANISLIVTCSVKDTSEHKMVHRIKTLSKNNKPIVVAGCLPAADQKLVEKINPNASLMGPNSIDKTIEIVNSTLNGQKSVCLHNSEIEKINLPRFRINPTISIVEIASGCLSECSFCQTKLAKGDLRSYRIGKIINQIKHDLKEGIQEIWLASTDNGCYGLDIGTNIVELLRKCDEIEEDYKIRVGMMNPMYLKVTIKDLVNIYSKSNKIFKFIHIPVQSGSEKILRKMKRGHTVKTFNEVVKQLREKIPDITIATDIITGFPEENDEDFELTLKMIKETEPDIINSSRFSPRPGTLASKMKRIDQETVTERSKKLHSIMKNIAKKRNSRWLGWEGDILIDEIDSGEPKGRNLYYKSVVLKNPIEDRISKANGNNKDLERPSQSHRDLRLMNIKNNNAKLPLGKTINVKITGYSTHSLEGIQIT
jgi:MiaB-like tRNA modifying enzyme